MATVPQQSTLPPADGTRERTEQLLLEYVKRNPQKTYDEICEFVGIRKSTLTAILRKHGYRRTTATKLNMAALEAGDE